MRKGTEATEKAKMALNKEGGPVGCCSWKIFVSLSFIIFLYMLFFAGQT